MAKQSPFGESNNITSFAGLLSLGLPLGVRKGDLYKIAVRQITSAEPQPVIIIQARASAKAAEEFTWRRSLGAFQLNIPVSTKQALLEEESIGKGRGGPRCSRCREP